MENLTESEQILLMNIIRKEFDETSTDPVSMKHLIKISIKLDLPGSFSVQLLNDWEIGH